MNPYPVLSMNIHHNYGPDNKSSCHVHYLQHYHHHNNKKYSILHQPTLAKWSLQPTLLKPVLLYPALNMWSTVDWQRWEDSILRLASSHYYFILYQKAQHGNVPVVLEERYVYIMLDEWMLTNHVIIESWYLLSLIHWRYFPRAWRWYSPWNSTMQSCSCCVIFESIWYRECIGFWLYGSTISCIM